jgi:hypothetical protein
MSTAPKSLQEVVRRFLVHQEFLDIVAADQNHEHPVTLTDPFRLNPPVLRKA